MKNSCIHIIFGPIGAGKSTFALQLAKQHHAIQFSTDEWFKALFFDDIKSMPELHWTFERILRCENQIWSIARQSINAGCDVIFDLGSQKVTDRERIKVICEEHNFRHQFYFLTADLPIRQARVEKRNEGTGDTFNFFVTSEMFKIANNIFEEPNDVELASTKFIDTSKGGFFGQ